MILCKWNALQDIFVNEFVLIYFYNDNEWSCYVCVHHEHPNSCVLISVN